MTRMLPTIRRCGRRAMTLMGQPRRPMKNSACQTPTAISAEPKSGAGTGPPGLSGGLAAQTHDWLQRAGAGLRYMISTGNEADVTAGDALQFLAADPGTSVLCCYLEGLTDGAGFLRAAAAARAGGKSLVALKGGRTAVSARAVTAHTGTLAGRGRVWDDVARAAGVIQVFSVEELVEVAAYLASRAGRPRVSGNRVAVLSYGGGQGVIAADQCTEAGLDVVPLSDATRAGLAPLLPPIASTGNPVDLTPEAFNQDRYRDAFPEVLDVLDCSGARWPREHARRPPRCPGSAGPARRRSWCRPGTSTRTPGRSFAPTACTCSRTRAGPARQRVG